MSSGSPADAVDNVRVKNCNDLAISVLCVAMTCCFCDQHAENFQCGCACTYIVSFVLIDLRTDQSPAHKVSFLRCNHLHAHVCSVSSLTFLHTLNHTKSCHLVKFFLSSCDVHVSVEQLDSIVIIPSTVIIDRVHRIIVFGYLNCQYQLCLLNLMSIEAPQASNVAFNAVWR